MGNIFLNVLAALKPKLLKLKQVLSCDNCKPAPRFSRVICQEIDAESPANLSKYDRICFCFRGVVYLAEVVEVHQQIVKPGFP
ncbi:MAG: hypothetical protein MUO89_09345, partial [Dehalococcoidia bacterium]|nr:hypothetical protein [Dehalococcoidia bacterium]